jgi:hypothetical protein
MARRASIAGALMSIPFTLSVALLCTTAGADGFYRPLSAAMMCCIFAMLLGSQVACGVRAFRGEPLARPLAVVTAAYMGGVFAVLLGTDALVRLLEPEFLPAGLAGTIVLWASVLAPLALLAALSAVTVAVGVGAARARLRPVQR